jgi:hypothetical protein
VVRFSVGGSILMPSALKSFPDFFDFTIALAIFSLASIGARFILYSYSLNMIVDGS